MLHPSKNRGFVALAFWVLATVITDGTVASAQTANPNW